MTNEEFTKLYGEPDNDDLERVNCLDVGTPGHRQCGICPKCNKPRFMCSHLVKLERGRLVPFGA